MGTGYDRPIRITFSCHGCGLEDHALMVRERREHEDILGWLEAIRFELGRVHDALSPRCFARTCDLKVPILGTDRIGGQPVQ